MANDVLQKFKSSLNRGVTTVNVKAATTIEKTKIKSQIDSLGKEIVELYKAVGENAYLIWESNSLEYQSLHDYMEKIKVKKEEIDNLNKSIEEIDFKNQQVLEELAKEAILEKNKVAESLNQKIEAICPNCGAEYTEQVKFCRKCGTKLL